MLIWWIIVKLWLSITIIWHLLLYIIVFIVYFLWNFKSLKWGIYLSKYYDISTARYRFDVYCSIRLKNESFIQTIKRWCKSDYNF